MNRADTAGQCYKAIISNGHLSEYGQRVKLSYARYVTETVEKISNSVAGAMDLEDDQIEDLKGLVDKAAKHWLNICSQRYRINVDIPRDITDQLGSRSVPDTMKLLVLPTLIRKGNKAGDDWSTEQFLKIWRR